MEAAGVREDRSVPAHEAVEPSGGRDHFRAGAEHQVVGVAEDDLRPVLDEVARLERLDRALGPDVHEDRRLDGTVYRRESSEPRLRAFVPSCDLKWHWRIFYQKTVAFNGKKEYDLCDKLGEAKKSEA